ncbi:MAG: DNA alkylation repair protein [Chloroflexota bacterium]
MTAKELVKEVRTFCEENANPDNVVKYSKYFKAGSFNAYGVPSEKQTAMVKEFASRPDATLEVLYEAATQLLLSGKYEEGSFLYLFLKEKLKELDERTFQEIDRWFDIGLENWAHTDVIAGDLLSPLLEKNVISRQSLAPWRLSPRTYKRRAAVVSLIKPMKKSKDIAPALEFILPLMLDQEEKVGQGLGWLLREAWKISPAPVEEFLTKYKNESQRVIFQYATEKMPVEQRAMFKRDKVKKA